MLRATGSVIPRCIQVVNFSSGKEFINLFYTHLRAQHFRPLKACTGQVKMFEEIQSNKRKQVEEGESCEAVKRTKLVPIGGGLAVGASSKEEKGNQVKIEEDDSISKETTDDVEAEKDDLVSKEERDQVKIEKDDPPSAYPSFVCATEMMQASDTVTVKVSDTVTVKASENNEPVETKEGEVKTIVTWNMNSITVRYKNKEKWNAFMSFFNRINADVLCFQEVRLPALNLYDAKEAKDGERDRGKVKNTDQKSQVDFDIMEKILKEDFHNYNAYFSLANIKYSGQLVLVKRSIPIKSIRYNLSFDLDPREHHHEGRVIIVEFSKFYLLSTYTPNNGFEPVKFERRRLFDEKLKEFVSVLRNKKKNLVWTGDLNIAPEDTDLSHPAEFRRMKKGNVPKEFVGQPGCTDFERKNFRGILSAGDLIDSYRHLANLRANKGEPGKATHNRAVSDINDNIYTWRCPFLMGKSCNKAMRIDHFIVSRDFMPNVENVEIHGYSVFHNNFYGSDHCPVILHLRGG
ncbi:AP endonuclease (DNA-[apurinic or apyrimidinic site] lyase), putative [Plasmodium knowlesi strain H]|uniref:DNA-(apurinic or apyrimidinic site) endonuclease n=3 Tax=Plasmodium knowlesi TaxID=5850 RepID=A0A5K1UNB0_PLAKH|nr:DNA-(apurinic or apyrimidinic site) lyase, putative [Plasmodium knowlesi strain H]OTN65780.1 DNA-(apurinic or apyrimidinic site) lyase [Plasmodium knowlesi]CAA9988009.1 DNA-(apurinic or apyrimidinic site) lyase, putative [Plasmodium knowlesi strain H]SBO22037.1 AP endonuclease (DNA-[apurinic or apyrimidinic site] lyase), putative [Plasmodium knowlesi strain H]SBO29134.1 AP endonuclease (DNA-[apurinic or apyrimidinic site] lyase), putative [Plasmodium knowlesi strain H]VVS77483.1 DNA-(apurin|eukprot:XP_002258988.1 AP endonuclease (DNA-(apurinic or apyrimidinic site) lyase), putative [Plasmodium knowlesi strain H]